MSESYYGLEEISIRNLGVIEAAEIEFTPGLNVLTGETGAGKTMILTALSLILGGKSDAGKIRTGETRAIITGRFLPPTHLKSELEEIGSELDDESLIITRILSSDGKSRLNAGGIATTAGRIAEIAQSLVEVHAQSSTTRLTKAGFMQDALDSFANLGELTGEVAALYQEYKQTAKRISDLNDDRLVREKELERLADFMRAFDLLSPRAGEIAEIESELLRLNSVDDLQQAVSLALNFMEREDISISTSLASAKRSLDHVGAMDPHLEELTEKLGDHLLGLGEITSSLLRYLAALDADPSRLEFLQERKSGINSLIKKFGEGNDREKAYSELLFRAEESSRRISDLQGGDERIAELEVSLGALFPRLQGASKRLTLARIAAADLLQSKITSEMRTLAMPHSSIVIEINSRDGASIDYFTSQGLDEVSILFTSHEGAAPGPISKIASGGELSRIMLAIEVVLASISKVPTYIFDEVDAGVGGKAAVEVGKRLKSLSKDAQVIVVTHLAQVAVWADNHLVVRKSEGGSVSISDVIALDSQERLIEISRMLSGQEGSQTAIEHARELLELVHERVIS